MKEKGYYIAIIEGSYGDRAPRGYGGIWDFVFINGTDKDVEIISELRGHITFDDEIIDVVPDKQQEKYNLGAYGYAELDTMDYDGYLEYNASLTLFINGKMAFVPQKSLIGKLELGNLDNQLKPIPILNKRGLIFDVEFIE